VEQPDASRAAITGATIAALRDLVISVRVAQ